MIQDNIKFSSQMFEEIKNIKKFPETMGSGMQYMSIDNNSYYSRMGTNL